MLALLKRADELEKTYIQIRRRIHQNPELAFEETQTTALVVAELKSYGIEVYPNGKSTGVIGILRGGKAGKVIALRADMDCLNITEKSGEPFSSQNGTRSHACGHDLHTAALLFCARLLSERASEIYGTIKFIFQPAEEGLQGAIRTIENGALENPRVDAIIALHTWPELPAGSIGYLYGPIMAASNRFRIHVTASGGHAAHPEKTADPIVVSAYIITQLQTIVSRTISPTEAAVVTIGRIEAGTKANIIPSEAIMDGTVRAFSQESMDQICQSICRIAKATASAMNAQAEVTYQKGAEPVINDSEMMRYVVRAGEYVLGKEHVKELPEPSMGGEDFANYLQKVPGALFRIGTADDRPASKLPLHNERIVFNEAAIRTGALVLAETAILYTGSAFEEISQNNEQL